MKWFRNKLARIGFPIPIEYITNEESECLIECPFKLKYKDWEGKMKTKIMVGSVKCNMCKYFVKKIRKSKHKGIVFCNYLFKGK